MSDELEPFRLAAELGCPDFKIVTGLVHFITPRNSSYSLPCSELHGDPVLWKRVNRCAAAVCAEWWQREYTRYPQDADDDLADDCQLMIDQARAFGRKYGWA